MASIQIRKVGTRTGKDTIQPISTIIWIVSAYADKHVDWSSFFFQRMAIINRFNTETIKTYSMADILTVAKEITMDTIRAQLEISGFHLTTIWLDWCVRTRQVLLDQSVIPWDQRQSNVSVARYYHREFQRENKSMDAQRCSLNLFVIWNSLSCAKRLTITAPWEGAAFLLSSFLDKRLRVVEPSITVSLVLRAFLSCKFQHLCEVNIIHRNLLILIYQYREWVGMLSCMNACQLIYISTGLWWHRSASSRSRIHSLRADFFRKILIRVHMNYIPRRCSVFIDDFSASSIVFLHAAISTHSIIYALTL